MVFYNTTTKQGICQKIDFLCDSDDTSYPRLDKTREVNESLKSLIGEVIFNDGTWQMDDPNQTDYPRGTVTLVEGQQLYSFATEYLSIEMVEILDKNGIYRKIKPLDPSELGDQSPDEYFGEDSSGNPTKGFPEYYDKVGRHMRLYPAPAATSVTLAAGIRISFQRNPVTFTAVSTTAADATQPGLSIEHDILAYMAAVPYCQNYKKDRVNGYMLTIEQKRKKLLKAYNHREQDSRKKATMSPISFR